jgi:hypothetical protein
MEKKHKTISKKLPPVKLIRKELESLFKLLMDEGFTDLTIATDANKLSIEEFLQLGGEVHEFEIESGPNPIQLSIDFKNNYVTISTGSDGTREVGLIEKIQRLLGTHRLRYYYLTNPWVSYIIEFLLALFITDLLIFILQTRWNRLSLVIITLPVFVVVSINYFVLIRQIMRNIIVLDTRESIRDSGNEITTE